MTNKDIKKIIDSLQLSHPELIGKALQDLLALDGIAKQESDVRLVQTTINEILQSTKVFQDYRHIPKTAIFGSARTKPDHPNYKMAVDLAKKLKDKGIMTITGAGPGIMEGGNEGAGKDHSFGLNIMLPFEQEANPFIKGDPKLINYKYFFTRKVAFIKESHATVIFPGGFGTHDEGFEVLTLIQTGRCAPKPVIMISHPNSDYWEQWEMYIRSQLLQREYISPEDIEMFYITKSVNEAVSIIDNFYKVYHSIRYIHHTCVMRLNKRLSQKTLDTITKEFRDLSTNGTFLSGDADLSEEDKLNHPDKARLIFPFNKVNYGKLYRLITRINDLES